MKQIYLTITTPEGMFFDGKVDIVTLKTTEGYIGIMKGIVPFVSSIEISRLYINSKGSKNYKICAIDQGLVFAQKDSIKILTDSILFADQVDIVRAQRQKVRAEQTMQKEKDAMKLLKEELRLRSAINRINVWNELNI